MSDDDLVKQPALRRWQESVYGKGPYQVPDYESMAAIVQEHEQMASRIEELTLQRDGWRRAYHTAHEAYLDEEGLTRALTARLQQVEGYKKDYKAAYEETVEQLHAAEAKLAKAVEALGYYNVRGYEGKEARTTLAELKGEKDE